MLINNNSGTTVQIMMKSRFNIYIGLDPAQNGSLVALANIGQPILLFCVAWKKVTRKKKACYKVETYYYETGIKNETIVMIPSMIGRCILLALDTYLEKHTLSKNDCNFKICVEDAYVGNNARTSIIVAKFSGQISGIIENHVSKETTWVRANQWRKLVLNIKPFTKREVVKAASLKYIPVLCKGIPKCLEKMGQLDHITDATGIALWGLRSEK